jgi:hypothetical protein
MKPSKKDIEINKDKSSFVITTANQNTHPLVDSYKSKKNVQSSLNQRNRICFGFRCSNANTKKISIDAGTFGKIELWLCSSCSKKFQ